MTAPVVFDRRLLARHRDRAAAGIAAHAFLLDRVAEDLLDRLAVVRRTFARALVLGAQDGRLSRQLSRVPGIETVISTETSPAMLALCDPPKLLADEEALPFQEGSLDLVVAPLTLQWVDDLPGALAQIRRALRPDGLLLAALLGGETLTELRQAFLEAESETTGGATPRVAPFADVRTLGSLLQRAGFALPVTDCDRVTATYPSPLALMRELKAMGAANALAARSRKPLRRATLARASAVYEARFGLPDGRIPATFEIMMLTAWAPDASQPKPLKPGSATMRLADALRSDGGQPSDR